MFRSARPPHTVLDPFNSHFGRELFLVMSVLLKLASASEPPFPFLLRGVMRCRLELWQIVLHGERMSCRCCAKHVFE